MTSSATAAASQTELAAAMRSTLGRFCTGITIVTATSEYGPSGFACQSFSALSLDPPMVLLCPAKSSTSWPRIAMATRFTINVLGADHEQLCRDFAVSGADKFAGRAWPSSPLTGAPVVPDALAVIDCSLETEHDAGDHTVVLARVLGLRHTDGDPLLFFGGQYRQLAG